MKITTAQLIQPGQRIVIAGRALKITAKRARHVGLEIKTAEGWRLMHHHERCVIASEGSPA
jgi:hypothetical protein